MPDIIKPDFVVHGTEKCAIYSLHVSPDGRRLVTGGHDCKMRVWDMQAVLQDDNPLNKPLSTIAHHTGAVNCVRWSPCGKYIASCSDDGHVLVLTLSNISGNWVPLGEKEANKETWDIFRQWHCHSKDVMHVEWSPDGTRLASCGLDNLVVVWQLNVANGAPVQLRGHNGMVKGLAWDPIGKYLATQGDGGEEKAVVVWRVRDWKMEVKNTRPFKNAPDETMFLRLSWSPCGQYLATANAFVKNENICALLTRTSGTTANSEWEAKLKFKGCHDPVVVASFHPKLLKSSGKMDACCAIGGSDRAVSVWSSNGTKPLLVVNDLFEKQIIDITWGGDGYTLAMCSLDGTVAIVLFEPKEIGVIATQAESNAELKRIYGDGFAGSTSGGGGFADMHLPEDATQLGFEARKQQEKMNGARANIMNGGASLAPVQPSVARDKQEESKTEGGKRRILPKVFAVNVAPPSNQPGQQNGLPAPPSAPASLSVISASSSNPAAASGLGGEASSAALSDHVSSSQHQMASNVFARPAVGSDSSASASSAPQPQLQVQQQVAASRPVNAEQQDKDAGTLIAKSSDSRKRKAPAVKEGPKEKVARGGSSAQDSALLAAVHLPLLPARPAQPAQSRQLASGGEREGRNLFLNCTRRQDGWTVVTCTTGDGRTVWTDVLREQISAIAGNDEFSAVGCSDGVMYVYSQAGRRLFPALVLSGKIAHLEASDLPGQYLLAVTSEGSLHVWNIKELCEVYSVGIGALLRGSESAREHSVSSAWVTPTGAALIAVSNGFCYSYDQRMKSLVRVSDNHFISSSLYSHDLRSAQGCHLVRALGVSLGRFQASALPGMIAMDPEHQVTHTISHAESMVASAAVLASAAEWKQWQDKYIGQLVNNEDEARLREVCLYLMPEGKEGSEQAKKPSDRLFLGHSRRQLLREILDQMRHKPSLQRCINELQQLLDSRGSKT